MRQIKIETSVFAPCKKAILGILALATIFGGCEKSAELEPASEQTYVETRKTAAVSSGAIGSGWVDITSTEQSEQRVHLESNTSGVVTKSWNGGADSWYMDVNNATSNTQTSSSTLGYSYNNTNKEHSFSMIKFPGKRTEVRIHDDYLTGTRQFEGYITINDKVFGSNAVFQILGSVGNATLMQIRADATTGTLTMYNGGADPGTMVGNRIIATGITGQRTRINVIHQQQTTTRVGRVTVYVNGTLKYSFLEDQDPSNTLTGNYIKYGNYGRYSPSDDAKTGSVVKWSDVKLWKDGNDGLPPAPTYYRIKVLNNPNYVLHSVSATPTNGTNVDLYSSGSFTTQQWRITKAESGFKRIASRINNQLVLEAATTPANGVNVRLGTWGGIANTRQQWLLTDIGDGALKISVKADATKVLDVPTIPANGVNVQLYDYFGNNRQEWVLEPVN